MAFEIFHFLQNISVFLLFACVCVNQHVTDNVCGSAFVQEDCEIEGENCRQMSVGSHTFTYTAKDMAGNENTCSFQVTIKPGEFIYISLELKTVNAKSCTQNRNKVFIFISS